MSDQIKNDSLEFQYMEPEGDWKKLDEMSYLMLLLKGEPVRILKDGHVQNMYNVRPIQGV